MKANSARFLKLKSAMILAVLFVGVMGFAFSPRYVKRVSASVDGPTASHTNAPGETNCTACHSDFELNSGTGGVVITGLPANYDPGEQVQVTVTVNQEDAVIYGFQLTAIDGQGAEAGTFTLPNENPQTLQLVEGLVGPNVRKYVEHTAQGVVPTQFGSKSWTVTWTAPSTDVGDVGFYAAGNAANSDNDSTGDYIYTTSESVVSPSSQQASAPVDFDGDGKTDISIHRPQLGQWWYLRSSDSGVGAFGFGNSEDIPVPADYTGDGKADIAFFRPSTGEWYFLRSEDVSFFAFTFGAPGDIPAPGDFDGDGIEDAAVYRPSTGQWFILRSSDSGVSAIPFGTAEDRPTVADFDGDGMDDVAVFRPSVFQWWQLRSTDGVIAYEFGSSGDIISPGDFTGDGKADVAFWRPSTGEWYVIRSEDTSFYAFPWGSAGDVPAAGDFDGDGVFDPAVWRESQNGTWFILGSTSGFQTAPFGAPGDVPLPGVN